MNRVWWADEEYQNITCDHADHIAVAYTSSLTQDGDTRVKQIEYAPLLIECRVEILYYHNHKLSAIKRGERAKSRSGV